MVRTSLKFRVLTQPWPGLFFSPAVPGDELVFLTGPCGTIHASSGLRNEFHGVDTLLVRSIMPCGFSESRAWTSEVGCGALASKDMRRHFDSTSGPWLKY